MLVYIPSDWISFETDRGEGWISTRGTNAPAPCSRRRTFERGRGPAAPGVAMTPPAGSDDAASGRGVQPERDVARRWLRERVPPRALPGWVAGRGFAIEPFGLELIPSVADLARTRVPHLAERIYAGDVMEWVPSRRWTFITALTDVVPPSGLAGLVVRLLDRSWSQGVASSSAPTVVRPVSRSGRRTSSDDWRRKGSRWPAPLRRDRVGGSS
jgi:hypothetical protein